VSETGEISFADAIKVLEKNNVSVSKEENGSADMYVLAKGDVVKVERLTDPVSRKMVHYLARIFDIGVHEFYHPEMAGGSSLIQ
jgi:hypothetical protein